MAEWVKILLSAGVGFMFAIVGEPLKAMLGDRRKLRLQREAIYRELAHNLVEAFRIFERIENGTAAEFQVSNWTGRIQFTVFEYSKSQPEYYFRLKDIAAIEQANALLSTLKISDIPDVWYELYCLLMDLIFDGDLDVRTLKSSSSRSTRFALEQYFKSHRDEMNSYGAELPDAPPSGRLARYRRGKQLGGSPWR